MRTLGIDIGDARIGVAISDTGGRIANPLTTVVKKSYKQALHQLASIAAREEVEQIVVGDPLNMDGSQGKRSKEAHRFAKHLQELAHVPVHLQDERLSTFRAEDLLTEAGMRAKKQKEVVDKVAASIILQDFLDREEPPT